MKLNSTMVQRTIGQFEAQEVPNGHPVLRQLNRLFGVHTFLLNCNGLHIVEPAQSVNLDEKAAKVVRLASWEGDLLRPHDPEVTDVTVVLEPKKTSSKG